MNNKIILRWNTISIDWPKVEEEPEKIFKVEGRFLLDLHAKTNDLEKSIMNYREKTRKATEDFEKNKAELDKLKAELPVINKNLDEFMEKNRKLEEDFSSNQKIINELNAKLKESESKITNLETEFKNLINLIADKENDLE